MSEFVYSNLRCAFLTLTVFSLYVTTVYAGAQHQHLGNHHSLALSKRADAPTMSSMRTKRINLILEDVDPPDKVTQWLSTLQPDGKWPDSEINYTSGCLSRAANWPAQDHWQRILIMAAAWHGGGPQSQPALVNDDKLKSGIQNAMNFWFGHDITNSACLHDGGGDKCPCTDKTFWNKNWFSNIIRIPELVGQVCLLVDSNSEASASLDAKCSDIPKRAFSFFYQAQRPGFLSGANVMDIAKIGIDGALKAQNSTWLTDAYTQVHSEANVVSAVMADGIRADGSFGQHSGLLYNGNYGKDFLKAFLDVESIAAGTEFSANSSSQDAFNTLLSADRWMIYQNTQTQMHHWDFSALGRFITFPVADLQATGPIDINAQRVVNLGNTWKKDDITQFGAVLGQNSSSVNAGGLTGNKMFYANDYMVHRGSNYVSTLKMYSSRTLGSECVNLQNPLGFHLSDGALYTYIQGTEYEDIAAAWDWNLIPGTTVDPGATPLNCDTSKIAGVEDFVGGVSDTKSGIAAMRFTNPVTKKLSWQKTWFFLDDDVQHVMISKVSASSNGPVFSVLDQRRHSGPVVVDGAEVKSPQKSPVKSTLWHGGVGYVFPSDTAAKSTITVDVSTKTGSWSNIGASTQPPISVDLFTATIQHKDLSASLEYTTFPGTTSDTFSSKQSQLNIQTIQNDADISAVYDAKNGAAFVTFWNSAGGSVTILPSSAAPITIQADKSAVLIYRLNSGNITVADPSQKLDVVNLQLSLGSGSPPASWKGKDRSTKLSVTFPTGGTAGSRVSETPTGKGGYSASSSSASRLSPLWGTDIIYIAIFTLFIMLAN